MIQVYTKKLKITRTKNEKIGFIMELLSRKSIVCITKLNWKLNAYLSQNITDSHHRAQFERFANLLYESPRDVHGMSIELRVFSTPFQNKPMQSNFTTCQEIHFTPSQLWRIKQKPDRKVYVRYIHIYL